MTGRRFGGKLALIGALVLGAGTLPAQDKAPVPNPEAAAQKAEPGPEHKRLHVLVGNWDCTVKYYSAGPDKPDKVTQCTVERRWILGNRFIEESYRGEKPAFAGLGLIGYDNLRKKYTRMWVDTMTTAITTSLGSCDSEGKIFTFEKEEMDPVTAKKVKGRDELRLLNNDAHDLVVYRIGPGGKQQKILEVACVRKPMSTEK
jgi:hypothetical protein